MAVILPDSSYVYIDIQSLSTEYNTGMIVPMKIILGYVHVFRNTVQCYII